MIMTRSQMMDIMSHPKIREPISNMEPQPQTPGNEQASTLMTPDHKKINGAYVDDKGRFRMRANTVKKYKR